MKITKELIEQVTATANYLEQEQAKFAAEPTVENMGQLVIAINTVLVGTLRELAEKAGQQ